MCSFEELEDHESVFTEKRAFFSGLVSMIPWIKYCQGKHVTFVISLSLNLT